MSVNKVFLVGNLGKALELRYTPSGLTVCSFSLATLDRFKDRQGKQQEQTEWHNIVAWSRLAEICNLYIKKGTQVYIEGKLQTRYYDDRSGNKRNITEVIANTMQILSKSNSKNFPKPDIPPEEIKIFDPLSEKNEILYNDPPFS